MKKLFVLKDMQANETIVSELFFGSKSEAKQKRNELNAKEVTDEKKEKAIRFQVARGPDHRYGRSLPSFAVLEVPQRNSRRRRRERGEE